MTSDPVIVLGSRSLAKERAHVCHHTYPTDMVAEHGWAHESDKRSAKPCDVKAVEGRRASWRIIARTEWADKTQADEQQATYVREYVVGVDAELPRIYASIVALMDENLILLASTGEPKVLYYEMNDDDYRFLAERATGDAKRQAPMTQKVLKTVEARQMQYTDRIVDLAVVTQLRIPTIHTAQRTVEVPKIVSQDRIPQRTAERAVDAPIPQVTEEIIEMFNVLSQDRVQQRNVEQITETPAVSLAEEIVEAHKAQTQEERIQERIIEEIIGVSVPHVTEETIEVVEHILQERVRSNTVEQIVAVAFPRIQEEL